MRTRAQASTKTIKLTGLTQTSFITQSRLSLATDEFSTPCRDRVAVQSTALSSLTGTEISQKHEANWPYDE